MNDKEFARFMRKITFEGECWLWSASLENGYGQFYLKGKSVSAHKLMLERTLGRSLGEGMISRHKCRNKHCCNPDHLEEGTHKQNAEDRVRDGTAIRGEHFHTAVLTADKVRAIRLDTRRQYIIAEEYGVTRPTIYQIQRRITWKHITDC
jgi:hypothetical protein